MALFGPSDKALPFLTQAYQIDTSNTEELRALAGRLAAEPRKMIFLNTPLIVPPTEEELSHWAAEDFLPFARSCDLIQEMMVALYDHGSYKASHIRQFRQLSKQFPMPMSVLALNDPFYTTTITFWLPDFDTSQDTAPILSFIEMEKRGIEEPDFYIPARTVSFHQESIGSPLERLMNLIVHILWGWVNSVMAEGSNLRKCNECQNLYVVQKNHPEQTFCSNRCKSRDFMRRKRKSLKQSRSTVCNFAKS